MLGGSLEGREALTSGRKEPMTGHYGLGHVHQLALGAPSVISEHVEGGLLVDPVALHQDALRPLRNRPAAERAFEIVVLREATEDDVDGALQLLRIAAGDDVGEDASLGRLLDEPAILDVQDSDDR